MTNLLFALIMTPALAIGWFRIIRLTRTVSQTALTAAAWWAVFAHSVLTMAVIASVFPWPISVGTTDQLWYFAAVSALCPLIAALGARFGRLRDWNLFIVLPLIVVLEWPALAQCSRTWNGQRLELGSPAQYAFIAILSMSISSYYSRFSWSTIWFGISWLWVLGHLGGSTATSLSGFAVAQLLLAMSITVALHRPNEPPGWNRVWSDYRDHFGVMWATRLMLRVNEVAERDNWPWCLNYDGLYRTEPASDGHLERVHHIDDPRVEQTFRWLLKQFVEPSWIDARLGTCAGDVAPSPPQSVA